MDDDNKYKYNGFYYRSKSEFFKSRRLVDEHGTVIILKNNVPRYLVIDFSKVDEDAVEKA